MHEAEEIFDRVDVLQGVLIGENPKVLGIKIYTYELEDIHQVKILQIRLGGRRDEVVRQAGRQAGNPPDREL